MLGLVIGDVVGSVYERHNIKTKDFRPQYSWSGMDGKGIGVSCMDSKMRTIVETFESKYGKNVIEEKA